MQCLIWKLMPLLFLLNDILNVKLEVERDNKWRQTSGNFYHSEDYFTNPIGNDVFCTARNATCSGSLCNRCYCGHEDKTFLSYQHGCLSYASISKKLKASQCMTPSSQQHTIPIWPYDFFKNSVCSHWIYLPTPIIPRSIGACKITTLTYYDIEYGQEMSFGLNQSLPKLKLLRKQNSGYYCLKCRKDCDFSLLRGHLLKLSINCKKKRSKKYINTCFIFSYEGKYGIDEDNSIPVTTRLPHIEKELHIERQYNSVLSSGSYLSSTDAFANPDADPKFCKEFDSHCCPQSSKCDNCSCNQQKLFLSYRHGCVEQKIASEMLGWRNCLKVHGQPYSISFIPRHYFKYGTCINLELPHSSFNVNHGEWTCNVHNLNFISPLTSEEKLVNETLFAVTFSSFSENQLCFQCSDFVCDLSRYPGMLMKAGIQCSNQHGIQTIDTCFAFTMDGRSSFNGPATSKSNSSSEQGSLEVERTQSEEMETQDLFTNAMKEKSFCNERKALCNNTDCTKCICQKNASTFVSYEHGCMNIEDEKKEYGIQNCISSKASIVKARDFDKKRCVYLQKSPEIYRGFWECQINSTSYFEPIYGEEMFLQLNSQLRIQPSRLPERLNEFCLQCDLYGCDLSLLSGKIINLGLVCKNETATHESCILLKMAGRIGIDGTNMFSKKDKDTTNSSPQQKKDKKGITGIIVGIIACVVAALVAMAILIFVRKRRESKKTNTRGFDQQIFDKSTSNMELTGKEIQHTEDYTRIGASTSQKSYETLQKSNDVHTEENPYYRSADESVQSNPIYSSTNITASENPIYDHEYNEREEDIYTEAHSPGSSRQEFYPVTDDGMNNPIYGIEEQIPAKNDFSRENLYYGGNYSPTLTPNMSIIEDEYAVVMKDKKNKKIS